MLSLLTPQLYYPDGQIYDENFVYGSFLQSECIKMACGSNCHDPHSAKLTLPKEQAACNVIKQKHTRIQSIITIRKTL
ncbi:hypothetical protein L3081_26005, partial [Colwellia sp. MSW7]